MSDRFGEIKAKLRGCGLLNTEEGAWLITTLEAAQKRLAGYEEESAICPEDQTFTETITALRADLQRVAGERDAARESWKKQEHRHHDMLEAHLEQYLERAEKAEQDLTDLRAKLERVEGDYLSKEEEAQDLRRILRSQCQSQCGIETDDEECGSDVCILMSARNLPVYEPDPPPLETAGSEG